MQWSTAGKTPIRKSTRQAMRVFILQTMNEAGLNVGSTLQELHEHVSPHAWSIVENVIKEASMTGQETLFSLLNTILPGITDMRQHKRTSVHLRCRISVHPTRAMTGHGVISDLSLGGCRLETNLPLAPGAELALHIHLPEESRSFTIDYAVARRGHNQHFGIEFLERSQESSNSLITFLLNKASLP